MQLFYQGLLASVLVASCFVWGSEGASTSASSGKYSVSLEEPKTVDGSCLQQAVIDGNGVHDTLVIPCVQDATVIADNNHLIVGDVIYSDGPSSLVLVSEGKCVHRTYQTQGQAVKVKDTTLMTDQQCAAVRKVMKEEIAKKQAGGSTSGSSSSIGESVADIFRKISEAANKFSDSFKGDSEDALYSAQISVPEVRNGKCVKIVSVQGNGVSDDIPVPCSMESNIITSNNKLVVGNTIYSDSPDTLVVVENGRCTQKTYKDGVPTTSKGLTKAQCDAVKKTMRFIRQEDDALKWGKWAEGVEHFFGRF